MSGPRWRQGALVVRGSTLEELVRENRDVGLRQNLASNYQRGALIFFGVKRTPGSTRKAIEYNRKSIAMARQVLLEKPSALSMRNFELTNLVAISEQLSFLGEHREADRAIGEALALGRNAYEKDPKNATAAIQMILMLGQASHAAGGVGDTPRAIGYGREALAGCREDAKRRCAMPLPVPAGSAQRWWRQRSRPRSTPCDSQRTLLKTRSPSPRLSRGDGGNIFEDEVRSGHSSVAKAIARLRWRDSRGIASTQPGPPWCRPPASRFRPASLSLCAGALPPRIGPSSDSSRQPISGAHRHGVFHGITRQQQAQGHPRHAAVVRC
jgi:hypothetical protein